MKDNCITINPLVSVMMPAYNAGKTIAFALASLQAQTYRNWECIVVDDGSMDDTILIVDSLQDKRIHLIRLGKNMGRRIARQRALEAAKGEYLAMLDADDWIYPEKLEKQVQVLMCFSEVDLVSTAMAIFNPNGDLVGIRGMGDGIQKTYMNPATVPVPNAPSMFRSSGIGLLKYDARMMFAEDADFLRCYLLGRKYLILPEVFYAYGEIASVSVKKMFFGTYYNLRSMYKFFRTHPILVIRGSLVSVVKMLIYFICGLLGMKNLLLSRRSSQSSKEALNVYETAKTRIQSAIDAQPVRFDTGSLADMSDQSKKKRICFVTTLPLTLKTFVRVQAESMVRNGWNVTWICAEDPSFYHEVPEGVKYIPLPFKRGIDPFGVLRAIFILYQLFKRERFDLVQYSTPNAAFYSSTAAWLASVPVRLYAQWGIRYVGFDGMTRQFFKLLERWCCRCSTVIEPDSVSNLEFSIKEGLYPTNKGLVIGHGSASGVNLERFDITKKDGWRTEYRSKASLEAHHLVIGFVGSIRRDKGCNELIAACRSFFSDMPEARLMLVGDKHFYNTIDQNLRDWVASSAQVIHIPQNSEIPQYMACMDIFSLPSYREGFGLVIVEAEAMGVPVVVSDVPGPIDAMRHGETGLVVPVKNAEALAVAVQTLLKDTVKRLAFGASAAVFARDNFEQKEFIRRVLEDKDNLLAAQNCAPEGGE